MMNKLTEFELAFIVARVLDNAKDAASDNDKSDFAEGKRLAYYEILEREIEKYISLIMLEFKTHIQKYNKDIC